MELESEERERLSVGETLTWTREEPWEEPSLREMGNGNRDFWKTSVRVGLGQVRKSPKCQALAWVSDRLKFKPQFQHFLAV